MSKAIIKRCRFYLRYLSQRVISNSRYKYICRFGDKTSPVLANCDDSISKNILLEHGWKDRAVDTEQVYDLVFDPDESFNLAGDSRRTEKFDPIFHKLNLWLRHNNDPVLDGPIPTLKGAIVNNPNSISPQEGLQTL